MGRLMLTVLGGLAEFERHPILTPYQRTEALRRRAAGETLVEIARSFNVSHMTVARATSNGGADDQG
jgi:DNA invertase Pin-like site-specific DNA recombinase